MPSGGIDENLAVTVPPRPGLQTRLVHPSHADAGAVHAGLSPTLSRSSTYRLDEVGDRALASGEGLSGVDVYGRYGNETTRMAGALIASLEGAEAGLVFASGMAAITAIFARQVPAQGVVVAAEQLYGGSEAFLRDHLPQRGVRCLRFSVDDVDVLERILEHERPALVYCESVANPLLQVAPLDRIGAACRRFGATLAVDNTFAAGLSIHPLEHGATLVVHSATKYLNGHSDVVAGAICASEAVIEDLWRAMIQLGGACDPGAAWLLARGIKTLPLRWARQCETAARLAELLAGRSEVARVHYPGLASHPSHERARRLLTAFGAIVTFDLADPARAPRFCKALRVCAHAVSLGGLETLISLPSRSSHASMDPAARARLGIGDGTVRVSVGVEDFEDLRDDLLQALSA